MKLIKNQGGYAMLVVLLLVVFIMTVTAVFMRGSISNAKQEHSVDSNHLSVVAAEMGVDYYKSFYENRYQTVKKEIWETAEKEASEIMQDPSVSDKEERINDVRNIAVGKLFDFMNQPLVEEMSILTDVSFFKTEEDITKKIQKVSISKKTVDEFINVFVAGNIIGSYNGKENNLYMQVEYPFPDLYKHVTHPGNGLIKDNNKTEENDLKWDWFENNSHKIDFIKPPQQKCDNKTLTNAECHGDNNDNKTDIKKANNSKIYFDGDYQLANGNAGENYNGSEFYIKGSLTLPNMNKMDNLKVISTGDIKIDNINGANNIHLQTNGDIILEKNGLGNGISNATIISDGQFHTNHIELNNSNIKVEQQFDVKGKFNLIDSNLDAEDLKIKGNGNKITNSIIVVRNELEAKKLDVTDSIIIVRGQFQDNNEQTILQGNSKMCVGGQTKLDTYKVGDDSKLFVLKKLYPEKQIFPTGVIPLDTLEEVLSACRVGSNNESIPDKEPGSEDNKNDLDPSDSEGLWVIKVNVEY